MNQGIRNTADAISMIQTADGALGVIDEKLIRMKELAEQAATGTYTTAQREIINSEYQAMAAEIDRIANATNFNGIKLLDGSVTNQHGGQGLKIHFGVSNNAAEDYYFVNIGDARATSSTGLRIGGDAKNDIWGQGAAASGPLSGPGCCTAGYSTLDGNAGFVSGETFSYGYNWDWMENDDTDLLTGRYLAGRYTVSSSESLQDLINKVNAGTQSRVGVAIDGATLGNLIQAGGTLAICLGDEAYGFGDVSAVGGTITIPAQEGTAGYFANGTYPSPLGLTYNRRNNFALTTEQRQALTNAGVNLAALGLNSAATVSGTASGETAAAAEQALLDTLNAAFDALGIANFEGIQVTTSTASASPTNPVDVSKFVASALANGGLTQNNGAGLVVTRSGVTVHTGVYRDNAGNWTSSKVIASALGLTEMVYRIENPNTSSNTYRAYIDWESTGYLVNDTWGFTRTQYTALSAAGVNIENLGLQTIHVVTSGGSNVDSATAFTNAQADAVASYINQTNRLADRVAITAGSANLTVASADVRTAAGAGNINGDNTLKSGTSFALPTNFYMDDAGNYTTDTALASTLGMGQISLNISKDSNGVHHATLSIDGVIQTDFKDNALQVLGTGATITQISSALQSDVRLLFTDRQAGAYVGGGMLSTASVTPPAGTGQVLPTTIAAYATSLTQQENSPLQVRVNGQLLTGNTGSSFNNLLTNSDVDDLVTAMNTSIGQVLLAFQSAATGPQGQLTVVGPPPAAISGPTSVASLTGYRNVAGTINASPERTVSTTGIVDSSKYTTMVATNRTNSVDSSGRSNFGAWALASAINHNENSNFWAMVQSFNSNGQTMDMIYVFTKEGGNFNDLLACDVADSDKYSRSALNAVNFENVAANEMHEDGTAFTLGGEKWARMKPTQTKSNLGNEVWNVTLNGRDVGAERDLWIANADEIKTPALTAGIINGMDRNSFVEIQNAADGPWKGAEVRTQSAAQEALDAITEAISTKDKIRADLGALQNRLENTMTNLTVQAENLQASESRISDVDVATEMTEFTRNNVLAQAATSMLAQANSLSQLALSLIG
jgi:flagellin-like hook-associated protein FlgL